MGNDTKGDINVPIGFDFQINELKGKLAIVNKLLTDSRRKNATASKRLTDKEYDDLSAEAVKHQNKLDGLYRQHNKLRSKDAESEHRKSLKKQEALSKASLEKMRSGSQARWKAHESKITDIQSRRIKRVALLQKNAEKTATTDSANAAKKQANTYTSKWKQAFSTLSRYMSAGAIIGAVVQFGRAMVTEFLNVEKAIFRISGITGDSIQETAKLTKTIYGLASSYGIATDDITSFAIEMAKLGKSATQIQQLGDATASLSVILGEDMSSSGKLLVTTMNQFNLVTSEASRVAGTFSNVIKRSPLAVDDLKTAMQYIGVAANAAGIEIEQLGEYMTLLSNSGLKASKIGTGLRNVILRLAKDGRTFNDVMDELYNSGISLTEALDLFGKRGATAGYLMIKNWGELNDIVSETPTAIEQMTNTLITASAQSNVFLGIWANIKSIAGWFVGINKKEFYPSVSKENIDDTEKYAISINKVEKAYQDLGEYDAGGVLKKLYDGTLSAQQIADDFEKVTNSKFLIKDDATRLSSKRRADDLLKELILLKKQKDLEVEIAEERREISEAGKQVITDRATSIKAGGGLGDYEVREDFMKFAESTFEYSKLDDFKKYSEVLIDGMSTAEQDIYNQRVLLSEVFKGSELTEKASAYMTTYLNSTSNAYSKDLDLFFAETTKLEEDFIKSTEALNARKGTVNADGTSGAASRVDWDVNDKEEELIINNYKELCRANY